MTILKTVFATAVAVAMLNSLSFATVVPTVLTGTNGTFSVDSSDTADASQGGTTSFTGTANFGSDPDKVIDGDIYNGAPTNSTADTLTPSVGDELILNLDPSSATGYDISSIVVLTGTEDTPLQTGRSDHNYTIALRPVGGSFGANIIAVADSTIDGEVQVTISDDSLALLGTGIEAIRFTFGNSAGEAQNMYREIDVIGLATISEQATPEPSTAILAVLGLFSLGMTASRRRKRA